uniref:Uncharacterized protein n=1 Tax=Oryza punctata TaxID=4537 RepID=A0A0E0K200_ORYPU
MAAIGGLAGSERSGCSHYFRKLTPSTIWAEAVWRVPATHGLELQLAIGIEARLTVRRIQRGGVAAMVSARHDGWRDGARWTVAPSVVRGIKRGQWRTRKKMTRLVRAEIHQRNLRGVVGSLAPTQALMFRPSQWSSFPGLSAVLMSSVYGLQNVSPFSGRAGWNGAAEVPGGVMARDARSE